MEYVYSDKTTKSIIHTGFHTDYAITLLTIIERNAISSLYYTYRDSFIIQLYLFLHNILLTQKSRNSQTLQIKINLDLRMSKL